MSYNFGTCSVLAALLILQPSLLTGKEKYALLVAVSEYKEPILNQPEPLKYPEEDAKALGQLLKSGGYEVELLLGKEAKHAAIQEKIGDLRNKADIDGVVLIGLFGHGMEVEAFDEKNNSITEACFCAFDTEFRAAKDGKGKPVFKSNKEPVNEPNPATLIKLSYLMHSLNLAKASNRVVLADCCRTIPNQARGRSFGTGFRVQDLPTSTTVLFGCSPNERAFEHQNWKHGAFTKCLLEGLTELSSEGSVETGDLAVFLRKRVPELVATVAPRNKQTPKFFSTDSVDLQLLGVKGNDTSPIPDSSKMPRKDSKDQQAVKLPADEWIDVLSMIKLPDHSVVGRWKQLDNAIACELMDSARVLIPVVIKGNYEVEFEFIGKGGRQDFVPILPVGSHQCAFSFNLSEGTANGLLTKGVDVRRKYTTEKIGALPPTESLARGQRYRCRIEVRPGEKNTSFKIDFNNQQIADWSASTTELSLYNQYCLPNPACLGVAVSGSSMTIHSARLRIPHETLAYHLGNEWGDPLQFVSDSPPAEIEGKCVSWKGHKYFISEREMSFPDAQQRAIQLKGRMLTISSKEEEDFLQTQAKGIVLWTSGWRNPQHNEWRDDRGRSMRYIGTWGPGESSREDQECFLAVAFDGVGKLTGVGDRRPKGWYDASPTLRPPETSILGYGQAHACIKWGEE